MAINKKGSVGPNDVDLSYDHPMPTMAGAPKILSGADVIVPNTANGITLLASGSVNPNATMAMVINSGLKTIYICGDNTVSSTNGLPLAVGQTWMFLVTDVPFAICASGETSTVRVVQFG